MAGLRLDTKDGILALRKNGAAVVPGKPADSLVLQRITHLNPARRMPPVSAHKTLTPEQQTTIKQWIIEGAAWQDHWAFNPPAKSAVPTVKQETWPRNPVDRFLLAKLEQAGLPPAAEASKRTLIRRVTLDLTGLPPTSGETSAFLQDTAPDAYERVVDRLLASQHYGEHRARYWLDAARYADTHGLHIDNYREMWPYRDWVINAFNRNLSFDRFVTDQLAGDLLPARTLDQQIASGFHRCNVTTNEGGAIEEEVAAIYAKDRVDTTSTVFLGLTVGCATCHDHKFDPIAQKDFYAMAAFFRNTTQQPMDGNISDTPPIVVVPRGSDLHRWAQLADADRRLRLQLAAARDAAEARFQQWLPTPGRRQLRVPLEGTTELLAITSADHVTLSRQGVPAKLPTTVGVSEGEGAISGRPALHFAKKSSLKLPPVTAIDGDRAFSIAAWVYLPKGEDNVTVLSQLERTGKNEKGEDKLHGWVVEINARTPGLRLIGEDNKAIQVRATNIRRLKPGTWNHLAFTYDGSRTPDGLELYLNGEAIATEGRGDPNALITGKLQSAAPIRLGSDGGKRFFGDGALADLRLYGRAVTAEEAQLLSLWQPAEQANQTLASNLTDAQQTALRLHYLTRHDWAYRHFAAQRDNLHAERAVIRRRGAVTLVMAERIDRPATAHILYRGQYDQPRREVTPAVPGVLPPLPANAPKNRLGLAQWLIDPSHPLLARVTVNRFWQEIFGTGIVKTAEDFGSQGEPPSHPELLDWLAVEFRESGWDVKKLMRLMVTSAAYRQSAQATPEKLKQDPENRLLARGPRYRMDGEMVRDYALAASGLLSPAVGGPSVKPYQPSGVWETVAMEQSNTRLYKQDHGDKLYRRSMYTFWKRSAPPASLDIFNAPSRESCTVRRERTNTPLQALVTMNDPQFVEAARNLAALALRTARADVDGQFDLIADRLLARPLETRERAITKRAYQDYLRHYDAVPGDARRLLAVGESKPDAALPMPEYAALTMVANQFLNLDEVLNK